MDVGLHLTNFANLHLALTKIFNTYLEKDDVDERLFKFEKSNKNLANIDDKVNFVIDDYKPKTKTKYANKKSCKHFK